MGDSSATADNLDISTVKITSETKVKHTNFNSKTHLLSIDVIICRALATLVSA